MPTTSNFGWTTPADTDLVKNGALAIRTLGNGIDTSMAELKGGTTGQVLSKTSNTDMDFTWVTTDDANAIQNAIVDAKGDLIAATANDTPARLAVGTNNFRLVADSAASTGLKWIGAQGCSVYKSGNQAITSTNTWTTITFDSENFDTDSMHSTSTNTSRITIPSGLAGKYVITANLAWTAGVGARGLAIAKNGTRLNYDFMNATTAFDTYQNSSVIVDLAVNDYIEIQAFQSTGGSLNVYGGTDATTLSLIYIGV